MTGRLTRAHVGLAIVIAAGAGILSLAASAPSEDGEKRAQILFSEGFDDANLLDRGWYDGDKFVISESEPHSGAGCIEFGWRQKGGAQVISSGVRHLFEPTDTVYLRYYIRLSPGWGWSGRDWHPHMTHFMTTQDTAYHGPAASHLTLYVEPVGGRLRLATQDISNKDAPHGLTQGPLKGGYNGRFYDSGETLFTDDKWHRVEALFRLNTLDMDSGAPNTDGIARGWFDGKLVIDRDDVVFRSVDFPEMKFNQFLMMPYFGPGLVPHSQSLWIDDLCVATGRVGPLPEDARAAE